MRIDSIESSVALDPLDVHARLEELRLLKQGWLDGEGEPFDPAGMDWLEASVREHYPTELPSPRIYPSPGGQILFEWKIDSRAASLEDRPGKQDGILAHPGHGNQAGFGRRHRPCEGRRVGHAYAAIGRHPRGRGE